MIGGAIAGSDNGCHRLAGREPRCRGGRAQLKVGFTERAIGFPSFAVFDARGDAGEVALDYFAQVSALDRLAYLVKTPIDGNRS